MNRDTTKKTEDLVRRAADAIRAADALLITAGAGMGVDSGLPDFRGGAGFWRAYPAFERLGLRFEELANPRWFMRDPHLAWGFYGHRLNLYRQTTPHPGFARLFGWASAKPRGGFVYTSNVDAHFQKAGFPADDGLLECHGSIHHLQCTRPCCGEIWDAREDAVAVRVDAETMRAADPLPACPHCGAVARPNIMMWDDNGWLAGRTRRQAKRYERWLDGLDGARLVVVECGAGISLPAVRLQSQRVAALFNATLIRINPAEPEVPEGHIALPLSAAAALEAIDTR